MDRRVGGTAFGSAQSHQTPLALDQEPVGLSAAQNALCPIRGQIKVSGLEISGLLILAALALPHSAAAANVGASAKFSIRERDDDDCSHIIM